MADEQGTDRPAGQPEDPPAGPGGPAEPGGLRRGLTHGDRVARNQAELVSVVNVCERVKVNGRAVVAELQAG